MRDQAWLTSVGLGLHIRAVSALTTQPSPQLPSVPLLIRAQVSTSDWESYDLVPTLPAGDTENQKWLAGLRSGVCNEFHQ